MSQKVLAYNRENLDMKITHREEKALTRRLPLRDIPWAEYMSVHNDKVLYRLREKVIILIKQAWKEEEEILRKNDSNEASDISSFVSKDMQLAYSPATTCMMSKAWGKYIHTFSESRQHIPQNPYKPFVLDFGSKNMSSNADLTLMNFDSLSDAQKNVLEKLQEFFGTGVDFLMLKQVFDIQLFMNAFLFFLPSRKALVFISGMGPHSEVQKRQLNFAKQVSDQEYRQKDAQRLIHDQQRALQACRMDDLLDTTSNLMTLIDDAYLSNGAWLHVLIEIQKGVPLHLAPIEYLQSAYENHHMMRTHLQKNASEHMHKWLNKYAFRLVHALRRLCMASKKRYDTLYGHAVFIVETLQNASRYDRQMFPKLKFSVGALSHSRMKNNSPKSSSMMHIFEAHPSVHTFHIPGRSWINPKEMHSILVSIHARLEAIENVIV